MHPAPGALAAHIAISEAAHKKGIECSSRNHTQLAEFRDSLGKAPIRHANTHPALDYLWELDHL